MFNWYTQVWLEVTGGEHGVVDAGNGWHDAGSSIIITAVPDPLYNFAGWSGNVDASQTNENPLTITMDRTRSLTANFISPEYDLVVNNAHATTFVNESQLVATFLAPTWTNTLATSTNLTAYLTNSVVWGNSFTQLACTGWTRTGSDPGSGTGHNTGLFALTNDCTIVFNWYTQVWLEVASDNHGRVEPSSAWHDRGTPVTLTAIPYFLYTFSGWSGGVPPGNTNDNPLVLTMDQSRTVRPNFVTRAAPPDYPWVAFASGSAVDRFFISASRNLTGPWEDDMSGCCVMPGTGELLVLLDSTASQWPAIQVYGNDGTYLRSIDLIGFDDPEGVCQVEPENDLYAIVEERIAHITVVNITSNATSIDKSSCQTFAMGGSYGNKGIEGIAFDRHRSCFYAVKEVDPMAVFRVDFSGDTVSRTELFNAQEIFAGTLSTLEDVAYDPSSSHLFFIGIPRKLVECDLDGNIVGSLSLPDQDWEGVCFSPDGEEMHVVGQPNCYLRLTRQILAGMTEEGATANIPVLLSHPWPETVLVDFVVSSYDAVLGQDYWPGSGTLVFAPGATQAHVTIDVLVDVWEDSQETITVSLENPRSARLGFDANFAIHHIDARACYVSPSGDHQPPFANWADAATNIQDAIDAAPEGYTVLVAPGSYTISSEIMIANGVTVSSLRGPGQTVIDGGSGSRCLSISHSEAVVEGFTITGGRATDGAGVYMDAGGRLRNCLVTGNSAVGMWVQGNPREPGYWVGGDGGGVYLSGGVVENCTVSTNSADAAGGGIFCSSGGAVLNTIVYGNTADTGPNWANSGETGVYHNCCTVPLPPGFGNFDDDPLFLDPMGPDFHLSSNSPCVDAGTNLAEVAFDLDGIPRPLDGDNDGVVGWDVGAYECLHTIADSDGDGLPDGWEMTHGLSPTHVADAAADPDGDGMSSRNEYMADTQPMESNSVLRITGISEEIDCIRLHWQGGVWATQYLERREGILSSVEQWETIFTNLPPTCVCTNIIDFGATNRTLFYRINVERQ